MKAIGADQLAEFLKLAGRRLQGDWVLLGGNVLPALGRRHRSTYDIDLVALSEEQAGNSLPLMEAADEMGWPVEVVNQAAILNLWKIPDFRQNLILLHQGETANIYRPNIVLFVRLKLERLNPADLADCLSFIEMASERTEEPFDKPILEKLVADEIEKADPSDPRFGRLRQLSKHLNAH